MVQPCEELWDWSDTCDVSNLQTMTVEILIAVALAGLAISIAVIFYKKEQPDRKVPDEIIRKLKELENFEEGYLNPVPDPSDLLQKNDIALKELPEQESV